MPDKDEPLERAVSPHTGDSAMVVPAPPDDAQLRAVQELLDGIESGSVPPPLIEKPPIEKFGVGWLKWDALSEGTRYRLTRKLAKAGGRRMNGNQWKHRKKKRREAYHRVEREGKLRRDRWMMETPDGLWFHYKTIAGARRLSWEIGRAEFVELLNTKINNIELYKYIFNIYRIDTTKGYTISNIYFKDRYSKKELYRASI